MGIPTTITNNTAPIYEASLMYEQNGKCGTTIVLGADGSWTADNASDRVWKIHVVNAGHSSDHKNIAFSTLTADNISDTHCAIIAENPIPDDTEIMGSFSRVDAAGDAGIIIILYKDCSQS